MGRLVSSVMRLVMWPLLMLAVSCLAVIGFCLHRRYEDDDQIGAEDELRVVEPVDEHDDLQRRTFAPFAELSACQRIAAIERAFAEQAECVTPSEPMAIWAARRRAR